jgi:hypothetical protein
MKNIFDPEVATVFTALSKCGFSVRYLYRTLYEMTREEADEAWQLLKDEKVDTEGNFLLTQANQRAAEWLKERKAANG